jgi:hypothetical protein
MTLLLLFACSDAEEECVAPTDEDCAERYELICNPCSGYADACVTGAEADTIAIQPTDYACDCVTEDGGLKTTPECEEIDAL